MYHIGYDLVIHDEGVEQMVAAMQQKVNVYYTWLNKFVYFLQKTKDQAIIEGGIAQNLEGLIAEVESYMSEASAICNKLEKWKLEYLYDIEEADGELYMATEE